MGRYCPITPVDATRTSCAAAAAVRGQPSHAPRIFDSCFSGTGIGIAAVHDDGQPCRLLNAHDSPDRSGWKRFLVNIPAAAAAAGINQCHIFFIFKPRQHPAARKLFAAVTPPSTLRNFILIPPISPYLPANPDNVHILYRRPAAPSTRLSMAATTLNDPYGIKPQAKSQKLVR